MSRQSYTTEVYIGIDPGKQGGIARLVVAGASRAASIKCGLIAMPDTERDIWQAIRTMGRCACFAIIEKVHSMPNQGVVSSFTFGRNYGSLRMALVAAGIRFDEIAPRTWQKALGIPPKKKTETRTAWKNRLKAKAQQFFPQAKLTLATADALLIAEYCRRTKK